MRSSTLIALLVSRAGVEAVLFASLAAALHGLTAGRAPLGLLQVTLLVFGAELVLLAILREARASRQSATLAVGAIGLAVVAGLALPFRGDEVVEVVARAMGFGLLGEALLWRAISIARGLARWHDVRSAGVLAGVVIALDVFLPLIDHAALPLLALAVVTATGIALSLARSSEELDLAEDARGGASGAPAVGTAFALGVLAIVVAAALPSASALLGTVGDAIGPALERSLFFVFLPLGYLAAYLVELVRRLPRLDFQMPAPPQSLDDAMREEQMRQAIAQTRPYVAGAVEVLVALVAVAFAILLVERLTREQRMALADGASLQRERVEGVGLKDMLAGLLPGRRAGRRPPHDDGGRAAAVRLLYWRLLQLSEAAGAGWRAPQETPREHARRLERVGERWRGTAPIVSAFEAVRYADQVPDAASVDDARAALARIEAERP